MDIESSLNNRMAAAPRYLPTFIAGLWIILFGATFLDLWQRWVQWDSELAHGIPVIAIFFGLLWKTGKWHRQHRFRPALEGALSGMALLGTSLLWFLAYAVNIQIIEQLLLLPALISAYAMVFGWKTVFHHRILLVFPIFAIPIWGSLNNLLLESASLMVGELVRLIEMPALIMGNSIYIPYGHILIADGCSGLRYFVIALTLAYLISYLNGYREPKLLLTLVIAAVLGLVTNWIRIFVLIVIGYHTEMQSSLMEDHELFGWILFGAICLPAIYFAPVNHHNSIQAGSDVSSKPASFSRIVAMSGVMAAGPLLGLLMYWSFEAGAYENKENALFSSDIAMPLSVLAPRGGQTLIQETNRNLFVRHDIYHRNHLSEKLVPYLPRLYDHEVWLETNNKIETIGDSVVNYQTFSEKAGDTQLAQLQWFSVGGHTTASRVGAKLLQIPATLQRDNTFIIVTIQSVCQKNNCENARRRLAQQAKIELSK